MKRIGVSYVYYFNMRYERVGHLFQDRYRSEPTDEDAYLFAVTISGVKPLVCDYSGTPHN